MKVIFAGPSLHGVPLDEPGITRAPPAIHGDVLRAIQQGATAIGLIDGRFGQVASVWHKEILYALSLGIRVLGASSMGALRAAECAAFGMIPIGSVAEQYLNGTLDDDAAVALAHAGPELGYMPLSEPLVDSLATIEALQCSCALRPGERERLEGAARNIFFAHRTGELVVKAAALGARETFVLASYRHSYTSVKRADAVLLVDAIRALPDRRARRPAWIFPVTPFFRQAIRREDSDDVAMTV